MRNLFTKKLDCLIIQSDSNDLTKGVNSPNCIKKVLKMLNLSAQAPE